MKKRLNNRVESSSEEEDDENNLDIVQSPTSSSYDKPCSSLFLFGTTIPRHKRDEFIIVRHKNKTFHRWSDLAKFIRQDENDAMLEASTTEDVNGDDTPSNNKQVVPEQMKKPDADREESFSVRSSLWATSSCTTFSELICVRDGDDLYNIEITPSLCECGRGPKKLAKKRKAKARRAAKNRVCKKRKAGPARKK